MKLNKVIVLLILILFLSALLRLYRIDQNPVSLFGDELDVGYHAYSILKTGQDYTGHFMPLHFQSLGEFRTPLYLYSAVPSVALFGISALGVRLPAAIFGILSVLVLYFLIKQITGNSKMGLIGALLLAISPWHIQYSRAGFEVTELLLFYLFGIYFFLRGIKDNKQFLLAAFFLGFTPWIYNIAKLYLPITLLTLLIIFWGDIKKISKKYLLFSLSLFMIIVAPFTFSTVFGGGADRFESISISSNPTTIPEIGFARVRDAQMSNLPANVTVTLGRLFHNNPLSLNNTFWGNYLQSFSIEFLFIKGDAINLRQSVPGVGEFYPFELIFLVLGFYFFLRSSIDPKIKVLVFAWFVTAPIPSALTQSGGTHPTRLFLMLPPVIFLMSYGIYSIYYFLNLKFRKLYLILLVVIATLSFIFYQHLYWVHYPWDSERWWQAGYSGAITSVMEESGKYSKVIISNAGEPSLIFFLGWSSFPPDVFQRSYPLIQVDLEGFGSVGRLEKFYFPQQGKSAGLYELGKTLKKDELYLATAKEVNVDLIREPGRLPNDLKMVKAIPYPSGEPAFYFFAGVL